MFFFFLAVEIHKWKMWAERTYQEITFMEVTEEIFAREIAATVGKWLDFSAAMSEARKR